MELITLAKNPVPSGAVVGALAGYDGNFLRYARWQATRGPMRGTICLFQGRAEFIEKYFETIADLRRSGFAVVTMDWRGQGGSHRALTNKRKGHIRSFAQYDKDLRRFMRDVVMPDCPPPYTVLAHSMGGNILLRNAVSTSSWFDRMILVAPMIALDDRRVGYPQPLVHGYAEIMSLIGFSTSYIQGGHEGFEQAEPFESNVLTSDKERWTRSKSVLDVAPELGLGSPTIGWLRAAYRTCRRVSQPEFARRINVPILLISAGDDTVVSTRAIEEFGVRLKIGNTLLIPGAQHEILMENDAIRQRFWAAFDAYLGVTNSTLRV